MDIDPPAVEFTAFRHPVLALRCPTCQRGPGQMCVRPSGHGAADAHRERKDLADTVFIAQHGEDAWIERLPENGWRVHSNGYAAHEIPAPQTTQPPRHEWVATSRQLHLDL